MSGAIPLHFLHVFMALTGTLCEYASNFGTRKEEKLYPQIKTPTPFYTDHCPLLVMCLWTHRHHFWPPLNTIFQCQSVIEQNQNYMLRNSHYCEGIWMLNLSTSKSKLLTMVNQFLWYSPLKTFYVCNKSPLTAKTICDTSKTCEPRNIPGVARHTSFGKCSLEGILGNIHAFK